MKKIIEMLEEIQQAIVDKRNNKHTIFEKLDIQKEKYRIAAIKLDYFNYIKNVSITSRKYHKVQEPNHQQVN